MQSSSPGGIGENGFDHPPTRLQAAWKNWASVVDANANASVKPRANPLGEASFHSADSKTQLWVIPTNEEVIVARQTIHAIRSV